MSTIVRETRETQIRVRLAPGGGSPSDIETSEPFLTHMIETLARYAGWSLELSARGDLRHHVIEDTAITLGLAFADALPAACARYGSAIVPMDEALVQAAVDVGGRPFHAGRLPSRLYEHFFRSFADNAGATLHIRVLRGRDRHHIVEAAFKAVGMSLRQALDPTDHVFSTKGGVVIRRDAD
jgi:imidazoleglycerol-phosphate dehydratase